MNYEDKAQYNFNLVYTMGDNVYTETNVLNVVNNTADDGDHIANVEHYHTSRVRKMQLTFWTLH